MTDTNSEKRNDMIRKVQALWARADHPNTPVAEAEESRKMAAKLMAKYQIDEMVLSTGGAIADDIIFSEVRLTSTKRVYVISDQLMELIHAISLNNDCRGIIISKPDSMTLVGNEYKLVNGGNFYQCIGYRKDVFMVKGLFLALNLDLLCALQDENQKIAVQQSFAFGYSQRIGERLREVRREREVYADSISTGMGLAVRSKKASVDDYYNELYPPGTLGSAKVKNFNVDPSAANRGRSRASSADLGDKARVGGGADRGQLGK